jgi:hypothetical protein
MVIFPGAGSRRVRAVGGMILTEDDTFGHVMRAVGQPS